MTHLCELCGEPATLRFRHGFQLVACQSCHTLLMRPLNWLPLKESLPREDVRTIVDDWRAIHT